MRTVAIGLAIMMALLTAVLGRITLNTVHRQLELRLDTQIQLEARGLQDIARDHGFDALAAAIRERDTPGINLVERHAPGLRPLMGYILLDSAGRRVAGTLATDIPPPGYSEFIHFTGPGGGREIAQGINIALDGGGRLVVTADRVVIHKIDRRITWLFTIGFILIVIIGALAILALNAIGRARLSAFEQLAIAVTAGDIEQRMPLDGSGVEFDEISTVLNRMLDRIALLVGNLREVSSALAHDLRTPLSRIRSRIEAAEAAEDDPAQKARLGEAVGDIDDLLELFGSLLALSELDSRRVRSRFGVVDLGAAIAEIGEAHRPAIEDSGRTLDIVVRPVSILGDRALLQKLVSNLIDNAMTHTPPGTLVSLWVGAEGDEAIIRVIDDGPGVAELDRSRMFGRLVRLDPSRSSPGHGLGLSIVAAIAAAHGGGAVALPGVPGLTIEVRLPLSGSSDGLQSN